MKEGSIVKGRITGIKEYGAFIKVEDFDGLVHISEFSDGFVKNINDIVNIGDVVDLKIIEVTDDHRLRLSYKAVNGDDEKILHMVEIKKGFTPLEEKLDDWIEESYQRMIKQKTA